VNLTRQDVQAVVDGTRNQIMQRMALRQDVQIVSEAVRSTQNINNQTQAMIRQAEAQRMQVNRRLEALENKLAILEQQSKASYALLTKISQQFQQTPQAIVVPEQAYYATQAPPQYAARPAAA